MVPLTLRRSTRRIPFIRSTRLSPTAFQPFTTSSASVAKVQPESQREPLRACGVADTAPEAGPRYPNGILRPEAWIAAGVSIVVAGVLFIFMPSSPSKEGHAMQKRILDQRKALERHEGDREEDETEAEKAEERELVRKHRMSTR